MINSTLPIKYIYLLSFFFISIAGFSQLPAFTLTVTPTPQTCLGNGSLSFAVSGNNPAATMSYAVYLLPNTTTPVTTVTTQQVNGLVAGNYQVLATQTLNGQSNTATATATITNVAPPLVYSLQTTDTTCGNDGVIQVTISSGAATGYEIISGPVIRPLQTSPVFEDLPSGQYEVRVHNACGDALVTTVQIVGVLNEIDLYPSNLFSGGNLETCGMMDVIVGYIKGDWNQEILFPLTFKYTVHPPGGGVPIIVNNTVSSGFPYGFNEITTAIPFYNGQQYTYDVEVTDACGNVFAANNNIVLAAFTFNVVGSSGGCSNYYLGFSLDKYVLPATVSFLSAPAGFNPSAFNSSHPIMNSGTFTYGSDTNSVPPGQYIIQIADACGSVNTQTIVLPSASPVRQVSYIMESCSSLVNIGMPYGRNIVSASVILAPDGYDNDLPDDVFAFASGSSLSMELALPGDYIFNLIDECGNSYEVSINVLPFPMSSLSVFSSPGCNEGEGSVTLWVNNGVHLESAVLISAPASFTEVLPYDVSFNIYEGVLYMNSLPEGAYVVQAINRCGHSLNRTFMVSGDIGSDNTVVNYNCGSFDIDLQYDSNVNIAQLFFLQKYNEETGLWEHPDTGFPYIEGDEIGNANARELFNNQINYNLVYSGKFRIVHKFYVYGNGAEFELCGPHVIKEFEFYSDPVIKGAYAFPCLDGTSEVIIDAAGMPPLLYEITEKDGEPFVLYNGESPYFMELEDGVYNFRITDDCNNLLNIEFDVTDLPPPHVVANEFCEGEDAVLSLPEFSFLVYSWWKGDDEETPLSNTYSLTVPEFDSETDSGIYHVRITSTVPGSCINIVLPYNLTPGEPPHAGDDNSIVLLSCSPNGVVNLNQYLSEGHDYGHWQDINATGALSDNVLDSDLLSVGTYQFDYVVVKCNTTDTASLTIKVEENEFMPVVFNAGCEGPEYHVSVMNISDFEGMSYNWSGPENYTAEGYQIDITDGYPGDYYVTITDAEGCSSTDFIHVPETQCVTAESLDTEIPRGISPGDAEFNNDFDLTGLNVKHLVIFNRYGLKVYEKENYTDEWHGQSDKGDLPTGTYYYVITLETGERHSGWVYLQRAG